MSDRDTSIPGNQIKDDSINQTELDITNTPNDGQIVKINMPAGDFTAIDLPAGGTEVNNLETDGAKDILSTEIPIGTGADTVNYKSLSGDVSMDNAGIVLVNDLTITNEAVEDFLIFDGTNWVAKGTSELVFVGTFTRDISLTSTQAITGIGFKPKYIHMHGTVNGDPDTGFFGFSADATESSIRNNQPQTANTWEKGIGVINITVGSANSMSGAIQSFDSDGFTLSYIKNNSPTGTLTVAFMAVR